MVLPMGNAGSRGDGDSPAGGWRFRPRSTLPGMDNIQDQIRVLQTSVRRQRFAIVALASILAGSALIGVVRPVGDATFDIDTFDIETITCKTLRVVDEDGKVRISAYAEADGSAAVGWYDKDGKVRIAAYTQDADGTAGVAWFDKDEKVRIGAATKADGTVSYPTKGGK